MLSINDAPQDLAQSIREFFPEAEWDHAASIAFLESGWNPFALHDSIDASHPCGAPLEPIDGVTVTAEYSVSYFQINACNFPSWNPGMLFNTRHNVGTAHMLWAERGWQPWYFSARTLGLTV